MRSRRDRICTADRRRSDRNNLGRIQRSRGDRRGCRAVLPGEKCSFRRRSICGSVFRRTVNGTGSSSRWGGGYAGAVVTPTAAILGGFVGVSTDTGHTAQAGGSFGMLPGQPNTPLQIDFAYRSEHMMAVIGRQLTQAFYGKPPSYWYWNRLLNRRTSRTDDGAALPGTTTASSLARQPSIGIGFRRRRSGRRWSCCSENGGAILDGKVDDGDQRRDRRLDAGDGVRTTSSTIPVPAARCARTRLSGVRLAAQTCLTQSEAAAINKIWEGPSWMGTTLVGASPRRRAERSRRSGTFPYFRRSAAVLGLLRSDMELADVELCEL